MGMVGVDPLLRCGEFAGAKPPSLSSRPPPDNWERPAGQRDRRDEFGRAEMPSAIAWLDFSDEEQRRAREIVSLFTQPESRDELGIGTVRDALSDAMFPGISVLQSRARYFLFVPWLFREGERRGRRGADLVGWVRNQERRLVEALRSGGDLEGLI